MRKTMAFEGGRPKKKIREKGHVKCFGKNGTMV